MLLDAIHAVYTQHSLHAMIIITSGAAGTYQSSLEDSKYTITIIYTPNNLYIIYKYTLNMNITKSKLFKCMQHVVHSI